MQRQIHLSAACHAICSVLIISLGLAACQHADARPVITATPDASVLVAAGAADVAPPPGTDVARSPLTGLPIGDPTMLHRRPLAVKISNAPDSVRPQAGIGQADLVFEHYVEGDLTRFTAIFWSQVPPRVGSIRSARLIDLELVAMYDALFVYSGASIGVGQKIAELPFAPRAYEGVSVGEPLYYRDPGMAMPHNLFAIPAEVWERAADDGFSDPPALRGMWFDPALPNNALAVKRITVDYGPDIVRWAYDPDSNRYARSEDGEPHLDANTHAQVTASNVVVIYAHHQPDYSIVESEWQGVKSYSTEIQIWTLGPAVIFRDGVEVKGYWHRWEEDAPLTLWADEAATIPLALAPGTTWFQVVPLDFTGLIIE